jgi:hypothetical protein
MSELTTLHVILEGGPRDGETRDIENRDCRVLAYGVHRHPHISLLDRYARTVDIDAASGRTVFRHTYSVVVRPEAPSFFAWLLEVFRLTAPAVITIE